jgi:hypothetical protein
VFAGSGRCLFIQVISKKGKEHEKGKRLYYGAGFGGGVFGL